MRGWKGCAALAAIALICVRLSAQARPSIALVGGTVIDGNGGAPIADSVVLVEAGRITAVGPRGSVAIPPGTTEVDLRGRWIVPGFIDTNVHLSLYGGQNERYETLVRYQARQNDIVLEAAQIDLSH